MLDQTEELTKPTTNSWKKRCKSTKDSPKPSNSRSKTLISIGAKKEVKDTWTGLTNKKITDNWFDTIEANQKATQQWKNTVKKNMEEKKKIQEMAKAEAKKVWPAKFEAVEKSWNALADNLDYDHSLASRAEIKDSLTASWNAGYNLDKAVIDDVVDFHNDTAVQRNAWKGDVKTFIEQKEAINKQYDAAFDYEMQNVDFDNKDGKWSVDVHNKDEIIDKWTDAQTDDI